MRRASEFMECRRQITFDLLQFVYGSLEDFSTFVDHDDTRGHRFHFLQNVGRQQNRLGLAQLLHRVSNFADLVWVQACRRFVDARPQQAGKGDEGGEGPLGNGVMEQFDAAGSEGSRRAVFDTHVSGSPGIVPGVVSSKSPSSTSRASMVPGIGSA